MIHQVIEYQETLFKRRVWREWERGRDPYKDAKLMSRILKLSPTLGLDVQKGINTPLQHLHRAIGLTLPSKSQFTTQKAFGMILNAQGGNRLRCGRSLGGVDALMDGKQSFPRARSHLSDAEISRILSMAHNGLTQREIADEVPRSQTVISRVTRRYQFESFVSRRQKPDSSMHSLSDEC